MRARRGQDIGKRIIKQLLEQMDTKRYLFQPKLNGDRGVLAVKTRQVHVFNQFGLPYTGRISNADSFLKLGDNSLFDGEIFHGDFCPFEALAVEGRSFMWNTAEERALIAFQMCRLIKTDWKYFRPTRAWFQDLRRNLPHYEGVVRKKASAPYVPLGAISQYSPGWLYSKWL